MVSTKSSQAYAATKNPASMFHAYLLYQFTLSVIQFVHVAVYLVKADILMEIRLQIVCRRRLAQGLTDTGNDQMTEHIVPYPVEADAVVDLVRQPLPH